MSSPASDPTRQADIHAITAIVERFNRAFATGDAGSIADDYADDAEWTNAFGVTRRGGPAIAAFLQDLVRQGLWATATFTASPPEVRFVRPDVAVEHDLLGIRGQRTPSGAEYPERRNHMQRVLSKDGGRWRVVAHLISDENARLP